MKIRPDELTEKGYILLDTLVHKELVPFIRIYMKKRTKYSVFYYLSNIIIFGLAVYFFVDGYNLPDHKLGDRFTHFAYGLAIAFLLIPLHEYIHVLAYKSQGATNTSYTANLKKFYFMALADKFVANKKEFEIVALAPFVIITTILTTLLFVVNYNWTLTIIGVLLTHTAMCSGDFGLLSYFEFHKDKGTVTFDDVENKISYFYGQTSDRKTTA
jgi:Putative zincin peptidase